MPEFGAFRYTRHAKRRMRERRIPKSQVEGAIRTPDVLELTHQGRMKAEKHTQQGNIIRVIYVEQITEVGRTCLVISVIRMPGS